MFTRVKVGAFLTVMAVSLCAAAAPATTPAKKAPAKHAKTIPARHNAGRPIHP